MGDGNDFVQRLLARVLEDVHRRQPGVVGGWGATQPLSGRRRAADALIAAAAGVGFSRRGYDPAEAAAALADALERAAGLARTETLLADQGSRDLLVALMSFRALGPRHTALPVAERRFRRECERVDAEMRVEDDVVREAHGHSLHRYAIPGREGPVALLGVAYLIHEIFEAEQYALTRGGVSVQAEPGDVILDGGGCWGETALYFAEAVGPQGRVLCCEFVPENLDILNRNLALNPSLAKRIEVVPHPLWDRSGETLDYSRDGGMSSLVHLGDDIRSQTLTASVDKLLAQPGPDRIDLLKLDVEGAELRALRGAEQTIRRHVPKLAISVYHRDSDLVEIPAWVADLDLGYELYLDHLWPGMQETILFAKPRRRPARLD